MKSKLIDKVKRNNKRAIVNLLLRDAEKAKKECHPLESQFLFRKAYKLIQGG